LTGCAKTCGTGPQGTGAIADHPDKIWNLSDGDRLIDDGFKHVSSKHMFAPCWNQNAAPFLDMLTGQDDLLLASDALSHRSTSASFGWV
jgi:hypothetical protein